MGGHLKTNADSTALRGGVSTIKEFLMKPERIVDFIKIQHKRQEDLAKRKNEVEQETAELEGQAGKEAIIRQNRQDIEEYEHEIAAIGRLLAEADDKDRLSRKLLEAEKKKKLLESQQEEADEKERGRQIYHLNKIIKDIGRLYIGRFISHIYIDGNNLCYRHVAAGRTDKGGQHYVGLKQVLAVVKALVRMDLPDLKITVYFDGSITKSCNDYGADGKEAETLAQIQELAVENAGRLNVYVPANRFEKADRSLLEAASLNDRAYIISNDKFADGIQYRVVRLNRLIKFNTETLRGKKKYRVHVDDLNISEFFFSTSDDLIREPADSSVPATQGNPRTERQVSQPTQIPPQTPVSGQKTRVLAEQQNSPPTGRKATSAAGRLMATVFGLAVLAGAAWFGFNMWQNQRQSEAAIPADALPEKKPAKRDKGDTDTPDLPARQNKEPDAEELYRQAQQATPEEAPALYRKAAEKGHPKAQWETGRFYQDKKDYTNARRWYELAAEQDEPWAYGRLGDLYKNGLGVKKSIPKAKEMYETAMRLELEQHSPKLFGTYRLAKLYEKELKDYVQARHYYRILEKNGQNVKEELARLDRLEAAEKQETAPDADAVYEQAEELMKRQKTDEAVVLFKQAAKEGSGRAAFRLGGIYRNMEDAKNAEYWYRQAIGMGYKEAEAKAEIAKLKAKGGSKKKNMPDQDMEHLF